MTRLPYANFDDLGPQGQQVWRSIVGTRGGWAVDADGHLTGPFNAFVQAPAVGQHLTDLGKTLRSGTSIERRLTEVAILTVGARWKAEFEWWAHAQMARRHGVADPVIDAIARGDDPPFSHDDERTVHEAARQLASSGRVSPNTYQAARQLLGDAGLVELVSLCGFYTLISFLLNTFEVPLPPDASPTWAQPPE